MGFSFVTVVNSRVCWLGSLRCKLPCGVPKKMVDAAGNCGMSAFTSPRSSY